MDRVLGRRRMLIEGAGLAGAAALAARTTGRAAPARQATPPGTPGATPAGTPGAVATPTTNAEVSGEIRYLVSGSGPEDAALIQGIFDDPLFRDRYPNLTVAVEPAPAAGGEGDPLLTSMIAGEAPDVFDTWTSRATPYIGAGQLLDLAPLMARDYAPAALEDFFPWVLQAQTLPNGFQWGMPRYVNLTTLVYNKDMVEEAGRPDPAAGNGWNQDTYREALIALTQRAGDRTRVYGGHVPVFNYGRFAHEIEAWGATAVDPTDPTHATFDSPEAQACAEWHRALMLDERAIADQSFLETGGGENVTGSRANFAAGRIATMEEGFYPFALADAVGDSFRFGIAPPPSGPAGRPVQGSADGFSIWQGSPNQDAAWEAVKFMSGPEFQRALAEATGLIPVRRSLIPAYREFLVAARPNLAEANVEIGLQLLETGNPHERPLFAEGGTDFSGDAEAENIINAGLERIFVVGDTPVTFLTELAAEVTEAMRA